jgi:hypothetical protein
MIIEDGRERIDRFVNPDYQYRLQRIDLVGDHTLFIIIYTP